MPVFFYINHVHGNNNFTSVWESYIGSPVCCVSVALSDFIFVIRLQPENIHIQQHSNTVFINDTKFLQRLYQFYTLIAI